jgi:hypothetical protein
MAVTTAIVDSRPKVRAGDPLAVSMVSTRNRGNASGAKANRATRSTDAGSVTKKRRDYVGKTPAKAAQALPPAIAAVVVGFAKAAGQLGLAATLSGLKDPTSFGAELAQLAATRATLQTATGGHVNVAEAAKILGVKSRQAVHQRIERRTLLAMNVAGQIVIPTYQFDGTRVRPEVTRAARLLAPAGLSEVAVVSWFTSPQPELDGITPATWLAAGSEATRVYEAARHTAGALAH